MKALWVILSVTFLAAVSPAATVTFDGYTPLDTCMSSISSEGLTFTAPVDCSSSYLYVWDGSSPNGNGTPALIYGFNPNPVAITQTGGGAFTLNDLQMTISWYDTLPSEDITLTAFFQGDGSTTQTLTLIQGLQTFNLNLVNVTEVDISGLPSLSGYWLMDNIDYNASSVPEPGTLAMLGSGLLAVIGVVRRKRMR